MALVARGTAIVRHAETGDVFLFDSDDFVWNSHLDGMHPDGAETIHFTQLEHPRLGTLKWAAWELPEGVLDDVQSDAGPHAILLDLELSIE